MIELRIKPGTVELPGRDLDAHRSSESRSEVVNLAHEVNFMLGQAEVRPSTREIQSGGRSLIIEPLAMQVLVVLGHAHGEVVSRNDLIEQCWGGRIVTEDAVTRVLSRLRRVGEELGDGAFKLQTIRGVGCRLIVSNQDRAHGHLDVLPLVRGPIDRLRERHRVSFCQTADGVTLAYGRLGEGPPLVRVASWFGHLEHEIENPIWHHWIEELSSRNMLLRYDPRGTGMSDRNVANVDFDRLVADLTTVVDAAGLDRFDLLAISQGTPTAVAFAARYPQRVRKLVLINSFASGWRHSGDPVHIESWEAMCTLIRTGWGKTNLALQKVFIHEGLPDGTPEQWDWLAEFQERSVCGEYAHRVLQMFGSVDVSQLLPKVQAPTLVMHCRNDQLVSPARGSFIASKIPGAQFVALDGRNHVPQPQDASWPQIQHELRRFLS